MSEVSAALQGIRKGDGTDTQPVLHLVELLKSRDTSHLPQLLTLSPSCSEVFSWWDRGPGQHTSQQPPLHSSPFSTSPSSRITLSSRHRL